jgi:hypothetical protein
MAEWLWDMKRKPHASESIEFFLDLGLLILGLAYQFAVGIDLPPHPLAVKWFTGLLQFRQSLLLDLGFGLVLSDGVILVGEPLLVLLPEAGSAGRIEGTASGLLTPAG